MVVAYWSMNTVFSGLQKGDIGKLNRYVYVAVFFEGVGTEPTGRFGNHKAQTKLVYLVPQDIQGGHGK